MTPFKGRNRMTSLYGWRVLRGVRQWHAGQDIVGDDSILVRAIWDAERCEIAMGYNGGRGNYVILYYSENLRVICQHLGEVYVKHGQAVRQGQNIGTMGNTGDSTGPHLHIEVQKREGNSWKATEPARYTEVPNTAMTHPGNDRLDDENTKNEQANDWEIVSVGPASSGDRDYFLQRGEALKLPSEVEQVAYNRWTVKLGPASVGDVKSLQDDAHRLDLPYETSRS